MKKRRPLEFAIGLFLGMVIATCIIFVRPTWLFRPWVLEQIGKIDQDPNKIYVKIDNKVVETLNNDFEKYDYERVYCLRGGSTPEYYTITGIDIPKVTFQSEDTVIYEVCSGASLLGSIHFHPDGYCALSNTDVYTFGRVFEISGSRLDAVICAKDKFGFYDRNNLNYKERLRWEII